MSNPHKRIADAVESARRQALIEQAAEQSELTLGELVSLSDGLGELATTITIGELVGVNVSAQGRNSTVVRNPANGTNGTTNGHVDTRSAAGRASYEATVLELIRGAETPVSAPQIRDQCGGTPLQARAALNRLIEASKISWTGKARGTRYVAK